MKTFNEFSKLNERTRSISLDYDEIEDIEWDGMGGRWGKGPKFVDAFVSSAIYKGRPMTDAELDILNDDRDQIHMMLQKHLY